MSCCPRIPAVNPWDAAKNQKRSELRALRKAQLKEEANIQTQDTLIDNNEQSA
jgi:hypothetical protein